MSRPIQEGDLVQISSKQGVFVYPIFNIRYDGLIYILIDGQIRSVYINQGKYQTNGVFGEHTITFLPKPRVSDIPLTFTNQPYSDLEILSKLDRSSLEAICLTNRYLQQLCTRSDFWFDLLIRRFGKKLFMELENNSIQDYYLSAITYPISSSGANLALMQADLPMLHYLESFGYFPNIQKLRDSGYHPISMFCQINSNGLERINSAEWGPKVTADFEERTFQMNGQSYKQIAEIPETIQLINGKIVDQLFFTKPLINGQPNPLYKITSFSDLVNDRVVVSPDEMEGMRKEIAQIYSFIPGMSSETSLEIITAIHLRFRQLMHSAKIAIPYRI